MILLYTALYCLNKMGFTVLVLPCVTKLYTFSY